MHKSSYRQTIEHIEEERAAAICGLIGPAILANHASIEMRLNRGASRILDLIEQQRFSDALQLMEHASWGVEATPPPISADDMIIEADHHTVSLISE